MAAPPALGRPFTVPPDFAGRGDDDWGIFLARFNSAADASGYDDAAKLRFLPCCLKGTAFSVYDSIVTANRGFTFQQVCTEMGARFNPPQQGMLLESEFRARVKNVGETQTEFAAALERLATRAFPGQQGGLLDRLVVNQFIEGQECGKLRLHIRTSAPANLNAAVQRAIEVGAILEIEGRRGSVNAPSFQAPVFAATHAPQVPETRSSGPHDLVMLELLNKISGQLERLEKKVPSGSSNGPLKPAMGRGQGRPFLCFNCGEPGHSYRKCPNSQGNGH